MKKLAVFLMIPVLALLTASTAPAFYFHHWGGIHGTYAMSATGNCLHWWSNAPDTVWGASNMVQGFFQFEPDGTGKAWGNNYPITPPPSTPICGNGEFSFNFTYKVTYEGAITVWMTPGSMKGKNLVNGVSFTSDNCGTDEGDRCTLFGMISSDHKTMSLATAGSPDGSHAQGYKFPNGNTFYANCSVARILFRMDNLQ
jgi:hypothetical protein